MPEVASTIADLTASVIGRTDDWGSSKQALAARPGARWNQSVGGRAGQRPRRLRVLAV